MRRCSRHFLNIELLQRAFVAPWSEARDRSHEYVNQRLKTMRLLEGRSVIVLFVRWRDGHQWVRVCYLLDTFALSTQLN